MLQQPIVQMISKSKNVSDYKDQVNVSSFFIEHAYTLESPWQPLHAMNVL